MDPPHPPQLPRLSRRQCLRAASTGALLAWWSSLLAPEAEAKRRHSSAKIASVRKSAHGVTLTLKLDNAPFPKDAKQYRDPTVLVFVPAYFRLPKNRRVDAVVHFHGHNATAQLAMQRHQLHEQLFDSKQNGILIVPQGPVRAADSNAGRLERRRGLAKMLSELLRVMRSKKANEALGKSSLAGVKRIGHLCLSAHSGGYRAVARCLARGGIEVQEVYLFDALYGEVDTFRRWVAKTKGRKGRQRHKLISHYGGGSVRKNNLKLLSKLKRAGVRVLHESKPGQMSRADLVKGSAIFIASRLSHGNVAVTHNNLRDCLFASGMKRHLRSKWFKDKNAPRKIDRRAGG